MQWIGIKIANQENLYTSWKKWGLKFRKKKRHQVWYDILAALVYHIWSRNHALWHGVVKRPDLVVKDIQIDVASRMISCIDVKWSAEDKSWLHHLLL